MQDINLPLVRHNVEIIKSLPFLDFFFSFTVTRDSGVNSSSWLPTGACNTEKTNWFSMDCIRAIDVLHLIYTFFFQLEQHFKIARLHTKI